MFPAALTPAWQAVMGLAHVVKMGRSRESSGTEQADASQQAARCPGVTWRFPTKSGAGQEILAGGAIPHLKELLMLVVFCSALPACAATVSNPRDPPLAAPLVPLCSLPIR